MTTKEITVPDLGGSTDVDVIEVHVNVGDTISLDDPLITLEGDKATMDVPAVDVGVVNALKVKVGDKVSEGSVILTLEVTEKTSAAAEQEPPAKPAVPTPEETAPPPEKKQTPPSPAADYTGIHAGPAVRLYARMLGADLTRIKATGPKDRILKEDVESYVRGELSAKQSAQVSGWSLPAMPTIDFTKFGEIETKPLNKIKKLTGANMRRNWLTVPHVTQFEQADITELEAYRQEQKPKAAKQGLKLTPLAFLLKAVVAALQKYPDFNASLDEAGENLIIKKYFHIGVAVNTPEGLMVPVIRDADKLDLFGCAEQLMLMSDKARNKKLAPGDMQGSCFTISSLGSIGGTAFTPIINAPDVAILGVSKAAMQPVYLNNKFESRLMLPLSLSYDHRVIDGVAAAQFTSTLGGLLSSVKSLL